MNEMIVWFHFGFLLIAVVSAQNTTLLSKTAQSITTEIVGNNYFFFKVQFNQSFPFVFFLASKIFESGVGNWSNLIAAIARYFDSITIPVVNIPKS